MLAACGQKDTDAGPGGVSVGEARALDDAAAMLEQQRLPPGVLGNDTGTGISVTGFDQPGDGAVTVDADGTWTYTPDTGFSGVDSFTYTITDDFGRLAVATVTITVGLPGVPVATDDADTDTDTDTDQQSPG